jgi:sulfatase maturation enzyme AslB (radical SAM superfamily)
MQLPLPDRVATWGDEAAFNKCRPEAGQWVFWEDRVAHVLTGDYDKVRPLHVELSPTYLCNFACPWCSCRAARQDWSDIDIFNRPDASPGTVMSDSTLMRVVDHLIEAGIGIQWVGGEPSMHPSFYKAVDRAAQGGLQQCLFTNGSLLNPKRIPSLLNAKMAFIRVSLDAVTEAVHRRHHDYDARRNYAQRVRTNLEALVETRLASKSRSEIGVSFVVDQVNFDDLEASADYLCALQKRYAGRAIDYVIIRPAYPFTGAEVCLSDAMVQALRDTVAPDGRWARAVSDAGIRVVAPDSSFEVGNANSRSGSKLKSCLSCGWFSEISPTGDMQLCSDRYGDPESVIGNLARAPVDTLWTSEQRRSRWERINAEKCAAKRCPRNGRGYHLNQIFAEIELARAEGRMDVVVRWIEDLRRTLPKPVHSFFL